MFVIALVGYLLATGLIGSIQDGLGGDDERFLIQAWLSGAIIFAFAVTVMRGGGDRMKFVLSFLVLIGAASLALFGSLMIVSIIDKIKECVRHQQYVYKYKHRFDAQPLAKCYCKDCMYHESKNGTVFCSFFNYYTSDDFFCKTGQPRRFEKEETE